MNKLDGLPFETIGERLRYLRTVYAKMSRKKFCEETGINSTMMDKYENNRVSPKIERIKEFANYFNISWLWLAGEELNTLEGFYVWDNKEKKMYGQNANENKFFVDGCGNLFERVACEEENHLGNQTIRLIPKHEEKERYEVMVLAKNVIENLNSELMSFARKNNVTVMSLNPFDINVSNEPIKGTAGNGHNFQFNQKAYIEEERKKGNKIIVIDPEIAREKTKEMRGASIGWQEEFHNFIKSMGESKESE